MTETTIKAGDVRVGDQLFNNSNGTSPPCYWWHNVTTVTPLRADCVEIGVGGWAGWYTRKHPEEAVTVRRPTE